MAFQCRRSFYMRKQLTWDCSLGDVHNVGAGWENRRISIEFRSFSQDHVRHMGTASNGKLHPTWAFFNSLSYVTYAPNRVKNSDSHEFALKVTVIWCRWRHLWMQLCLKSFHLLPTSFAFNPPSCWDVPTWRTWILGGFNTEWRSHVRVFVLHRIVDVWSREIPRLSITTRHASFVTSPATQMTSFGTEIDGFIKSSMRKFKN